MSLLTKLGLNAPTSLVTPVAVSSMAAAGEVVFIDVRESNEVTTTGLPKGSVSVPLSASDFVDRVRALLAGNPNTPIAISCLTGTRSSMAARKLYKAGLLDLLLVKGGHKAWSKEGLPTNQAIRTSDN